MPQFYSLTKSVFLSPSQETILETNWLRTALFIFIIPYEKHAFTMMKNETKIFQKLYYRIPPFTPSGALHFAENLQKDFILFCQFPLGKK